MDFLVSNISSPNKSKVNPWLVCFLGALFFFYEFIQMNMFNALNPKLMQAFTINADQLGNLSACYFYALIIMLIPVGILLEYIPTKKLILIGMSISMIGTLFLSLSTSFRMAEVCRFLSGIGGAFAFQSCLRLTAENFPSIRLALANGLIITFAMLGGIVAQTPLTLLVDAFNWRHVLCLYVTMGIIFYIFIALGLPGKAHILQEIYHNRLNEPIKEKIKKALFNCQTWLAGIYTCLLNLPVPILGAVWGSFYLSQVGHLSRLAASNIISMLFLGIIIGSPLFGWVSDYIKQRRWPMVIGALCSLVTILIIIFLPGLSNFSFGILFFLLGLFSSAETLGYAVVAESNPGSRSTALSFACLLVMGGGAAMQPFFGWLLEIHWGGVIIDHVKIYPIAAYNFAMLILPVSFVIGLIAAFCLREPFSFRKNPGG